MKQVVYAAFTLLVLSAAAVQAQGPGTLATKAANPSHKPPPTDDKAVVKLEELPPAVKATLASPVLKSWLPTEAFLVRSTNGKEYYAINIKKENEVGSVQIDKNGKPVR